MRTGMKTYKFMFKGVCLLALAGYIWYTLDTTVFCRSDYSYYQYKTYPFWSYAAILDGKESLIKENLLNVALFVPIGFLLCSLLSRRRWWMALIFGLGLSTGIELMQLVWKRGTCEFDDVFHNTIGCLIGYGLCKMAVSLTHLARTTDRYEDN